MNPRLIKRLDLIAAGAESQRRDEIARFTAAVADIATQRATLATYQSRLTESWTNGALTSTAAAQRAERFCAAARIADAHIIAREQQIQTQLTSALQSLTSLKTHRRTLGQHQAKTTAKMTNMAEMRIERDRVNSRK